MIQHVGNRAYKLQLPEGVLIHLVFHISQLKLHIGDKAVPSPDLPFILPDGVLKTGPECVLQVRQIPHHNLPIVQWRVQWQNLPPEEAMWEDADSIKHVFPASSRLLCKRG
jgi:hypothetical protein